VRVSAAQQPKFPLTLPSPTRGEGEQRHVFNGAKQPLKALTDRGAKGKREGGLKDPHRSSRSSKEEQPWASPDAGEKSAAKSGTCAGNSAINADGSPRRVAEPESELRAAFDAYKLERGLTRISVSALLGVMETLGYRLA